MDGSSDAVQPAASGCGLGVSEPCPWSLAERPGQEFTSIRIGKELGRSAGAVGNALATMSDQSELVQSSTKPRHYAIAGTGDQVGAAR